ncbi:MAG TPA: protein kinase [Vicinamibacterales bacterium]|nr:protein kinase [Vicinamibacterales bacterium]
MVHSTGPLKSRLPRSPLEVVPAVDDVTRTLGAGSHAAWATDAAPLRPGTIVNGRYHVERLAGAGGMGFVYRALDVLSAERPVALKMIRAEVIDASALGMFKAEFKTMASLKHPNVAEVYDFEPVHGDDGGQIITMEFIEGCDISRAAAGTALDERLGMLVQVCRALSYLHSRHVIHFDLKPANVYVSNDGVVKVLDFGIAGLAPLVAGKIMGTPHYMAPEVLLHAAEIDHRADLYALGVLTYHLLFGRVPYDGRRVSEIVLQQMSGPPAFDGWVPGWLVTLVRRLLAREPAERFRSANEVIAAINDAGLTTYELETRETKESYILSSRFVGRHDQRERFVAFVEARTAGVAEDASFGGATVLVVGGPSGMGKSRLLREVRQQLQLGRVLFIEADCFERGASEYAPVIDALRQLLPYVHATGGSALLTRYGPELVKLLPELATLYGLSPSSSLASYEHERRRLINALVDYLLDASAFVPYALYFNDLQWAKAASTTVLLEVARAAAYRASARDPVRLALIATYRSDEVEDRPANSLLEELRRNGLVREELLKPLSTVDVEEVFRSMLGVNELADAFFLRLCEESGGNPFFLQELVRVLVEDGSIFLRNGTWTTVHRIDDLRLPDGIANTFRRRLRAVRVEARMVLDTIALFGRPMPISLLERALEGSVNELHAHLATLIHRMLLTLSQTADGLRYTLAHDRMREVIIADLAAASRRERHGRIAEAIEIEYASALDDVAGDLAHHFRFAELPEKECQYALRAGDQARARYESGRAIDFFERALALLDSASAERIRIWDALADLLCLTGEYVRAESFVNRLAAVIADSTERARLERRRSEIAFQRGELRQALDAAWQSVVLLGGPRPRTRLGFAWRTLTTCMRHRLQLRIPALAQPYSNSAARLRAMELATSYQRLTYVSFFIDPMTVFLPAFAGLNAAELAGDWKDRPRFYAGASFQYAVLGRYRTARELSDRAIAHAERLHSIWSLAAAHSWRGGIETWAGQLETALDHSRKARDAYMACGDIFEIGNTLYHMLEVYYCRGEFSRLVAEAKEYLELFERTGSLMVGKAIQFALGRAYGLTGQVDDAIRLGQAGVVACERSRDVVLTPPAYLALGESYLAAGRLDDAFAQFEAARTFRKQHRVYVYYAAPVYRLLAEACIGKLLAMPAHDRQRSSEIRRLPGLLRRANRQARLYPAHQPPTLLTRARYLRLTDGPDGAITILNKSIAAADTFSARFWLAQAHEEMAACLREKRDPAAAEYAAKAQEGFAWCGVVRPRRAPMQ